MMNGRLRLPMGFVLTLLGAVSCAQQNDSVDLSSADSGPARRIISLAPHLTELVYSAGAGDFLVGTVEYSDYPAAATALPRVGDAFRVDYEVVSRLTPDLILVWPSGNPPEIVQHLRQLGFRVVPLEPKNLDDIANQLLTIGDLAGTRDAALEAANSFRREIDILGSAHATAKPVRVFYQVDVRPIFTVTGQHVIGEIIELCGGDNIFSDLNGLAPPVTLESILTADPEVIIVSFFGDSMDSAKGFRGLETWQQWENLTAVRNGNLFAIQTDLVSRSSTRVMRGARQICAYLEDARSKRTHPNSQY